MKIVLGLKKGPIKIRVEKWISCKIQALNLCETSPCLLNESITQRRSFSQHVTSNFKLTTPGLQKLFLLSIPSFRNVEWKVFISGIGLHSLVSCIIGIASSRCFSHPICCSQFPCEVVACALKCHFKKKHGQSLGDKINSFGCKVTPNSLQLQGGFSGRIFLSHKFQELTEKHR